MVRKETVVAKIIPPTLQQAIQDIGDRSGEQIPAFRLIAKVSSHEAVVRMLSQAFPGSDEGEVRQVLAKTASVLRDLDQLVRPTAAAPAVPKSAAKKELTPPAGDAIALSRCDKVKVHVDGGAKGNPGPAGIGIVFTNLDGKTVLEEARYIGKATNNVAEYTALITALKILIDGGRREAYFFSDSELMVNQMTGAYKVKNEGLMPLVREAQALRRKLDRFQIAHVPREENKRADELVNLAIRQAMDAKKM